MMNRRSWGTDHSYNFDPGKQSPYWDWIKDSVRPEDWKWLWCEGMKESYRDALPYMGAVKFTKDLRKLGDVVILTSRPEGSWTETIEWWNYWVGYTPAGYNFFRNGKDKHNVDCDVYIDDNVDYALNLKYNHYFSQVLLFDRAWNQDYRESDLIRVASYEEALKEIENAS